MTDKTGKKTVMVTGATGGIGRCVVAALVRRGDRVIATGRNEPVLEDLTRQFGASVLSVALDVSDRIAISRAIENLTGKWQAIDVLINNAGHDVGGRRAHHEGTAGQWASIIETNVIGLMSLTRAMIPGMLDRGTGHIVNMGSVAGVYSHPKMTAYNASKFAVHGFTESLRKDYATTDIRVTEILPGLVRTGFAEARLSDADQAEAFYDGFLSCLDPEDVANAVMYALEQPAHVNVSQVMIEPTRIGVKS